MARKRPIPLTVVVGPLGAGKTTLINRLLREGGFSNTAVIQNEFGQTGIESAVVERVGDGLVALAAGCICCAVRGEMIDALERLLRDLDNGRVEAIDRVVIEADAAADPSAIFAGVGMHPYLSLRFRPGGIVSVIDAADVPAIVSRPAVLRQVAMADVVAVSKTAGDLHGKKAKIAALNPLALVADAGTLDPSALLGFGPFDPITTDIEHWLGPVAPFSGGAQPLNVFRIARDRPMPLGAVDRFLDFMAALQGGNLVRVRGIVATGEGESAVVEGIGGFFLPPRLIPTPPEAPATRFSATASNLDRDGFESYLDAFLNEARIDTPDRAAMIENPLAIAGFSARSGR